jgi:D-sedoheptulose 7-phosphate isomerase
MSTATRRGSRTARRYLGEVSELLRRTDPTAVAAVANVLWRVWENGRTVFLIGNGGSATTASHLAWDLARQTQGCDMPALHTVALTDNVAAVTALANDAGASRIFADQMRVHAKAGDALIWFSCSCRSPNVVAAIEEARSADIAVVGLGGFDGGALRSQCDEYLHVPSYDYGQIEAAHIAFGHCIAIVLRERAQG